MTHLFLFTIGPVQSFIAQARKTRDLYAGSHLLSTLVRTAMDTFKETGGKVIFPDATSTTQPNRFLGYLDTTDLSVGLDEMGEAVETAVRAEWRKIAVDALGKLSPPNGYYEQVEQALEIFWVFRPAAENDYATAYRDTERSLGAIKNARPVRQYHYQEEQKEETKKKVYGERGRKCSLDGERNVKFYRLADEKERDKIEAKLFIIVTSEYKLIENNDVDMKVIAPGEGLSAVSWIKRNQGGKDFKPTAFFAAADFLSKVQKIDLLKQKLELIVSCYGSDWDEQLLFEENYTHNYFKQQGIRHCFGSVENALEQLKKLHDACKNEQIAKPNGYYAILHFDGDNMGQWLSGANLVPSTDGKVLFDFHEELAACLANYSRVAGEYLTPPHGKAVYAGGDDFLGFVTLDHAFSALEKLRVLFDQCINKPLFDDRDDFPTKDQKRFSFSAGLVIAHYKTPLHVVLDWARSTECH